MRDQLKAQDWMRGNGKHYRVWRYGIGKYGVGKHGTSNSGGCTGPGEQDDVAPESKALVIMVLVGTELEVMV